MKFVKGVTIFLVLCFAAYGAFSLLKPPPRLSVSESEKDYLKVLGIEILNGEASESGLSGVLGDVHGVAPVGFATETSASSAPPSFLVGSMASSAAPPFAETAPLTTAEVQPTPAFSVPATNVLPPPNFVEPIDTLIQTPLQEAPAFESVPPFAAPPSATESPPPWKDNWDGPASDLSTMSSPSNSLTTLNTPPPPTAVSPQSVDVKTPLGRGNVRRISSEPVKQANSVTTKRSVSLETAQTRYTPTSARQPLSFEPVRPENSSNTPRLAFTPPKRIDSSPKQQPTTFHSEVKQDFISPSRLIENPAEPLSTVQSPVRETVERFIQSQQQLVETGETDKIRLAFIQLSQSYENNQYSEAERGMMRPILDRLALKVIYSKDAHILESPYRVKSGETVETIAKDYNLNPALLRKINGFSMTQQPVAGAILKVVFGQFDAQISTKRKEMTILLGGLYAGRFTFTCPHPEISERSGEYFVTYKTNQMVTLNNGWILATPYTKDATIVFADQDAKEIFDILSEQSVFVVE